MILIGENIHIISNNVKNALINKDEIFITELVKSQNNMDFIDLNIGPAKGNLQGIFSWLNEIILKNSNVGISFDTTNIEEMKNGLKTFNGKTFINSTSKDEPKLTKLINLAKNFNSNLIALTLSKETGIPKTADGRLEIAFEIYEKCIENEFNNENLYFDPLILPICIDQNQALEALNTIKMIKESFEPPVKTVIGLSNISNGCSNRNLLNRVFASLAFGAGLDAAIIDAKDIELIRILRMLEKNSPQNNIDKLYVNLAETIRNFGEISDISYDKNNIEEIKIIKTANILLNKEIYSHSFTQL